MRHRWMCLPMIGLLCLLGGCGGGGEPSADELALQIRGEYLSMEGFTAHVQEGETFLEYDGVRVETGPLNEAGLSPMDALPALLSAVQEGYLAECSFLTVGETETLHLTVRDPEGEPGVGTEVQLWLDPAGHGLLRGEISQDGRTVIQCVIQEFHMHLPPEGEAE